MKEIWVLSIKTSLPDSCMVVSDIGTDFFAFESFASAKEALRKKLREFAFSKNEMFDGEGNMTQFRSYVDDSWAPDELDDVFEEALTRYELEEIYNGVKNIFEGKDYTLSELRERYDDGMIALYVQEDTVTIFGDCDGPINGVDPQFYTNMFDMSEEKDYFLYK